MNRTLLCLTMAVLAAGCSHDPAGGDAAEAENALKTALQAWQAGASASSLASGTPAMTISDYRWEAGFGLTNFEIGGTPSNSGFDLRFAVDLWLTPPKGKKFREKAYFTVITSPSLTIVRDPES